MKFSFACVLAVLAVLSLAFAEDVSKSSDGKTEKWYSASEWGQSAFNYASSGWDYNPYGASAWVQQSSGVDMYGYTVCDTGYPAAWVKAVEPHHDAARRSISIKARSDSSSPDAVKCESETGKISTFSRDDCAKAAEQLVAKKVSKATHNSCTLTLTTPKGIVAAHEIPTDVLKAAANKILDACAKENPKNHLKGEVPSGKSKAGMALVLSKS